MKELLTPGERSYIEEVLRPIKDAIKTIRIMYYRNYNKIDSSIHWVVTLTNDLELQLLSIKKLDYYYSVPCLEANKEYTPKELGLWEE